MTQTSNRTSRPHFLADPASITQNRGGQIDFDLLGAAFRTTAVLAILTANAAQGANSLAVQPLKGALPKGAVIEFGGAKFARTSQAVAEGAASIPVDAIPTAMVTGDTGAYGGNGPKYVKAGTVMVRVSSGKIVPRAARPGNETAVGILLTDASDESNGAHATSGFGMLSGGVLYENLLPETLNATIKNELNAAGTGFSWATYRDNR